MTKTSSRIIIDILIICLLIPGYWFLALPLAIISAWYFPYFVEVIIAGIVYDALFGFIPGMGAWQYAGTIGSVIIFLIMFLSKKVVRR